MSEMAVRDWARTVPEILAAVGNDARKIDVDYSGDAESTHLTMFQIGGAPDRYLPIDDVVMLFNCWGRGRGAALDLARAVSNAVWKTREIQMNDDFYLRGAEILSTVWQPDPTGQARYVVSARFVVSERRAVS